MNNKMKIAVCGLLLFFSWQAQAEVVGKAVTYRAGDTLMQGYLAYDNGITGKRPGILVVHEWWGHNEYARDRAKQLAALGYTALAVDMYGNGQQAEHPEDAGKFASEVNSNMEAAAARFDAANQVLKDHETVSAEDISAIGYCFGGGIVLEMARRGMDLDLVASFHGSLGTEYQAESGEVNARVLTFNGADDPFVKPEAIADFKAEMERAQVDYMFVNYPGAKHSFTNPGADVFGERFQLPLAYDAEADRRSWTALQAALRTAYGVPKRQ